MKFTSKEKEIISNLILNSMQESSNYKHLIFADKNKIETYQNMLKNILDKLYK